MQVAQLPLSLPQDEWQHICVSWTLRDGVWKAYQGGKLKGRGEGLAAWHPIKPGGVLILGQEQVRWMNDGKEGWMDGWTESQLMANRWMNGEIGSTQSAFHTRRDRSLIVFDLVQASLLH